MNKSVKTSILFIRNTAAALICAFILFFLGQALAKIVPDKLLTIPYQTQNTINFYSDMLLSKNSYSIAKKYIISLTDSTVKFEELPSYRTDIPFAVISELFDSADTESVTIRGLSVELICTPYNDLDLRALKESFESVYGIERAVITKSGDKVSIKLSTLP